MRVSTESRGASSVAIAIAISRSRRSRKSVLILGSLPCNRGLPDLAARAEEGRDAVRAPEAHPEARPAAIARTLRRTGRVPPRRHRPESPEAGQAHHDTAADNHLSSGGSRQQDRYRQASSALRDTSGKLFNRIDPFRTSAATVMLVSRFSARSSTFVPSGRTLRPLARKQVWE
jgi:hypothetical protein